MLETHKYHVNNHNNHSTANDRDDVIFCRKVPDLRAISSIDLILIPPPQPTDTPPFRGDIPGTLCLAYFSTSRFDGGVVFAGLIWPSEPSLILFALLPSSLRPPCPLLPSPPSPPPTSANRPWETQRKDNKDSPRRINWANILNRATNTEWRLDSVYTPGQKYMHFNIELHLCGSINSM